MGRPQRFDTDRLMDVVLEYAEINKVGEVKYNDLAHYAANRKIPELQGVEGRHFSRNETIKTRVNEINRLRKRHADDPSSIMRKLKLFSRLDQGEQQTLIESTRALLDYLTNQNAVITDENKSYKAENIRLKADNTNLKKKLDQIKKRYKNDSAKVKTLVSAYKSQGCKDILSSQGITDGHLDLDEYVRFADSFAEESYDSKKKKAQEELYKEIEDVF